MVPGAPQLAAGVRGGMTDRERLLAFAIAYRMLGRVSEAEDVVQEALLRVHHALDGGEQIGCWRSLSPAVRSGASARSPTPTSRRTSDRSATSDRY